MSGKGWIAVDLDGTLAHYEGWQGPDHVGAPIPAMVARVKAWLAEGRDVRIFTARVAVEDPVELERVLIPIRAFCACHIGQELPVTNVKDFGMAELWDDRAKQVLPNTGQAVDELFHDASLRVRRLGAQVTELEGRIANALL